MYLLQFFELGATGTAGYAPTSTHLNKQMTCPKTKSLYCPFQVYMGYLPHCLRKEKEVAPFFAQGLCGVLEEAESVLSELELFAMIGGSEVYEQIALIVVSRTLKSFEGATCFHLHPALPQPQFLGFNE